MATTLSQLDAQADAVVIVTMPPARAGETLDTEASRNVLSLAMVEAAVLSATERRRVVIADVVAAATA